MEYESPNQNLGGGSGSGGGVGGGGGGSGSSSNLNPPSSEPELTTTPTNNMCGSAAVDVTEGKAKEKSRRYWTPSEEERLYEIWGRDNWRLTRTGKNTIFFAQWAEELKERFAVDVKPEEIQMKVNQTRAKFRSVKKQLLADPTSYATRWKKYDIINRILKNLHRPTDAEPLPPEALLNNRDMTPPREDAPAEPIAQPPQAQTPIEPQPQPSVQPPPPQQQQQQGLNLTTEGNFNNNNNNNNNLGFSTELFTDQYDDVVKQEYEDDYERSMPFQEPLQQYSPAEPTQLLELQTPHQLQQLQQQQQQQQLPQFAPQVNYDPPPPPQFPYNNHHPNQPNQVAVVTTNSSPLPLQQQQQQQQQHQAITAVAYINSTNNTISVATNGLQMPAPAASPLPVMPVPTPRKRGRPFGSVNPPSADSLESMYMEEVRRKNQLLSEQTKISRQRLELEERKLDLMQTFFPKCIEQQAQILSRIMQMEFREQHSVLQQAPEPPPPQPPPPPTPTAEPEQEEQQPQQPTLEPQE